MSGIQLQIPLFFGNGQKPDLVNRKIFIFAKDRIVTVPILTPNFGLSYQSDWCGGLLFFDIPLRFPLR